MTYDPAAHPSSFGWRVGRSVGRTIYQMVSDDPSKADVLIGLMDTPELAAYVVDSVNRRGDADPDRPRLAGGDDAGAG